MIHYTSDIVRCCKKKIIIHDVIYLYLISVSISISIHIHSSIFLFTCICMCKMIMKNAYNSMKHEHGMCPSVNQYGFSAWGDSFLNRSIP